MKLQQKSDFLSTRVQYISTTRIRPNPQQPRRSFPEDALAELAESIRCYGILQPLTVRRAGGDFELIAGERRLRAARLAGLREVPCLIARVGEEDSALLALIENLQRRDLDYWEEADALARLIRRYDLTQEQAAEKLGKSQSALAGVSADKLRKCVIAYEPIWAIGTGKTATAEQAAEVCTFIRTTIRHLYGARIARSITIQYGGSMKPSNAAELLSQPDIDGGLIGGAALKAGDFVEIINAANQD